MSTLIRSAIVALALASASAAMARPIQDPAFVDQSKPYGGYSANSQEGIRHFWEYQTRRGN
jgi:hypothetical protein